MKNLSFYSVLVIFTLLNTVSSCNSDDNPASTAPLVDVAPIVNAMTQGTWRVTYYVDHTQNETDHFTGYNFTFGAGNVLTASNGTITNTGTWSVTNNISNDDSSNDNVDFNILFTSPPDFEDISDDWDIISRTDTKMQLIDVSGGNENTDYLTFEKN